jgi:autotransporter passenger strand-loop-strand repeat protein
MMVGQAISGFKVRGEPHDEERPDVDQLCLGDGDRWCDWRHNQLRLHAFGDELPGDLAGYIPALPMVALAAAELGRVPTVDSGATQYDAGTATNTTVSGGTQVVFVSAAGAASADAVG